MSHLRVVNVPQPHTGEDDVKVRQFAVRRVKQWGDSGWEVWVFEDGAIANLSIRYGGGFRKRHKTKRLAIAWAKEYAEARGFLFELRDVADAALLPLGGTADDRRAGRRRELRARVVRNDRSAVWSMGPDYIGGGPVEDWPHAAERWLASARDCLRAGEEAVEASGHSRKITESRIDWAIECLMQWRTEVKLGRKRNGLEAAKPKPES